ncbi:MAG TPA: PDZ domain-containing protein [Solirubrobacteraceae bacterium]
MKARARPKTARRARQLRIALLAVLVGILSAGAAYGVTTLVFGSGASASGHPYLGIGVAGSPLGIVITDVAPGSPAAKAGLQPGDLITAIDNQPVSTVDDVGAALDRLHAGNEAEISYTLGPMSYTAQAKLTARPPGYP